MLVVGTTITEKAIINLVGAEAPRVDNIKGHISLVEANLSRLSNKLNLNTCPRRAIISRSINLLNRLKMRK